MPSSLTFMCERKLLCGDSFQNRSGSTDLLIGCWFQGGRGSRTAVVPERPWFRDGRGSGTAAVLGRPWFRDGRGSGTAAVLGRPWFRDGRGSGRDGGFRSTMS